jgi:hypothetical protein
VFKCSVFGVQVWPKYADAENQVIIAADVAGSVYEGDLLPSMLDELKTNMKTITGRDDVLKSATVLGDTGYFSQENLEEAEAREVDVLIPDHQFRKRDESFVEQKGHEQRRYTKEILPVMKIIIPIRALRGRRLCTKVMWI